MLVVDLDGAPWFIAQDVCRALGYKTDGQSNVAAILRSVDETEKRIIHRDTVNCFHLKTSGNPNRYVVSEKGLYHLSFKAQRIRPEVVAFQDWVSGVVLPAIRKDHGYIAGEEKVAAGELSEDKLLLKAFDSSSGCASG
ncbi:Bro-N domain-containing protein [Rhodoplanes sp. SY1]|uniref:BRO-N domain-containing protein n=1 Tax=Rhodoplanes sp. SY1 TaxID=3166646 RepID=UPI0038B66D1A